MHKKRMAALLAACLLCVALPMTSLAQGMDAARFGPFDAEDLLGDVNVTNDVFENASITLVNYWATWCGPCIQELPDLASLSELTGGKIQVVSVLLDSVDSFGKRDESAIEAMHTLAEDAGVAYPVLVPDTFLSIVGSMVSAIPTTFVVDGNGVLLDTVIGSMTAEEWIERAQEYIDDIFQEDTKPA